jgi:2-amino-4-hydroxy-6-hydroxymethyldihydropteridine diphosphokinase
LSRCLVSVGSNIQPDRHVPRALDLLRRRFGALQVSTIYVTTPVGDTAQPDFWNLAVSFDTDLTPEAVSAELHDVEERLGRRRDASRPWGPRSIDLDLVMLGDLVGRFAGVELPSPQLARHAFVAVPVAELAPDGRHPVLGVSLAELARRALETCDHPPRRMSQGVTS